MGPGWTINMSDSFEADCMWLTVLLKAFMSKSTSGFLRSSSGLGAFYWGDLFLWYLFSSFCCDFDFL